MFEKAEESSPVQTAYHILLLWSEQDFRVFVVNAFSTMHHKQYICHHYIVLRQWYIKIDQHYNYSVSALVVHTGISCQNFFHSAIIPPCKVSWVSREVEKLKKLYFTCLFPFFQPKWNDIQKSYKNYQNPLKSYWFLGYFQSLFNFGWKTADQTN